MAPELEKLRSLPTPRWTLIVTLGLVVLGFAIALFTGSADESEYVDAADGVAGLGSAIGSIVIGVWIVGLEYGQGTLRRALAADPRRGRLLAAKLTVAVAAALALTLVVWLATALLLAIAASANAADSPVGDILTQATGSLIGNPVYAAVGCAVAMLARSMAGGMTAMLALVFVLDSLLAVLPIGDISLGSALGEIAGAVEGEDGDHELGRGILVTLAWVAILLTLAWGRFTRTDVT